MPSLKEQTIKWMEAELSFIHIYWINDTVGLVPLPITTVCAGLPGERPVMIKMASVRGNVGGIQPWRYKFGPQ